MGASMNDRAIELINAEIDGVLSGSERAELNRMLLADPSIRSLRDELRETCQALDAVPPEELPAGLHESIMSALPASSVRRAGSVPAGHPGRPVLRYAAALAGGLLVIALAFQHFGGGTSGLRPHDLVGTLAPARDAMLQIDLPTVKGQVVVAGTAAGPVVTSRLAATSPVTVIASADGHEVRLHGFVAPQQRPIELSAVLEKSGSMPPIVIISVIDEASGAVLQTEPLSTGRPEGR
jgi:anti-sigma factor RsiW